MNVNGLNTNNNIVDANSINQVSESLLSALQKKSVDYSKANLSKFQRPTVGVDLYNSKTNIDVQRQIAMTNSGVFQQVNSSAVQALNSFAAQQLYANNVQEKVGGKMTIETPDVDFEFVSEAEDIANLINVFETNKDKKDSNPFSFGEFSSNADKKEA